MSAAQEMAREVSKGEKKSASDLVTLDIHDLAALEYKVGMCKPDDVAKYRKGSISNLNFGQETVRKATRRKHQRDDERAKRNAEKSSRCCHQPCQNRHR